MFNGERYLRECIESILVQTYTDFELLLVDDGSTDDTRRIAESYARTDTRIRLSGNTENLGLVENWNHCIALARADWIKFVFQDDTIHPECLARMLAAAAADVRLVSCQRTFAFDPATQPATRAYYTENRAFVGELFATSQFVTAERCQQLALRCYGINIFGEPTSTLIHRSALEQVGLFNPALLIWCDFELWNRIAIHFGVAVVAEDLATFRVHESSATFRSLETRQFRSAILDSLVVLHQFARDAIYEPVRRTAAALSPPVDLRRLFAWQCHEAQRAAEKARRDDGSCDRSHVSELRDVTALYPAIQRKGIRHVLWRLTRPLRRRPELPIVATAQELA